MPNRRSKILAAFLCLGNFAAHAGALASGSVFSEAREAETRKDWSTALQAYENIYDSTRTTLEMRAQLWKKFSELRPLVPTNTNPRQAGTWRVRAYAFRELDFTWSDRQKESHHAKYRYRQDELDRLRTGMQAFAEKVWEFSSGNLRIDWKLEVIETPLTKLDGDDSFWPGPDACMPLITGLQPGDTDTIMVFAKVFGDPSKGETSGEVPQMLLGGAIGVNDPLTRGATYIAYNWGSGTAANEPDGEPMMHEWLHSAQWSLEEHQGYPPGLMCSSDWGRMEGESGGDPCYRRRPDDTTWMRFYRHIMRDHVTRRMWRELSPNRPATNVWLQEYELGSYTDPQQLECPWPKMSHYKQPWRGYLETRSGYDFLHGLGVNLHLPAGSEQPGIRLLAETGFKTFRIEIGWGEMNWEESRFNNEERFRRRLELCAEYNIRPTILLNAHQGVPCPVQFFERQLVAGAKKGDRLVRLDDVKGLVPGRSGLNGLSDYWAAEALITDMDKAKREVTLSKPLPKDLAAGKIQMATLKYSPLCRAGEPEFDETAQGWTRYALMVCELAKRAGTEDFDLEIWNELTFGSQFLDIKNYYEKGAREFSAAEPDFLKEGGRCWELARRTAQTVKKHYPRTRIIWGFSNTTFFHCPIDQLAPGIDGQSYHPYGTGTRQIAGRQERADQPALEGFVPFYTLRLPEGWAGTFIQTESLMRLLQPEARLKRKAPGATRFYHYLTEHGVLPTESGISEEATAWRLKALCATRSFCFWLNKGVDALHYFDAYEEKTVSFGILPSTLPQLSKECRFEEVATPPMRAIHNLVKAFSDSLPLQRTDSLGFEVTALGPQAKAFDGDATHQPLWERDLLALLPFQVNEKKHVVAVYIMSRDATKAFAPASFRIRISGVKSKEVEAMDVLSGEPVALRAEDGGGDSLVVTLPVTDSPELLLIGK